MLARSATRHASKSPFVHVTKGRTVKVKLSRRILYELDGGDREKKKTFCVDVQPNAVSVCVPAGRRLIAEH
jgi:diacylglycerol kinase family enzyme